MAETIVSKSYRIATDSSGNFDKISMWKKADDVKVSDNTTSLESTIGSINGIANNLTTTEAGYALDARQGAVLAAMFGGLTFGLGIPEGETEEVWGYTTPDGVFVAFGGESGMTAKLLWTNSAPTSTFSPQTVNLDFSEYSMLIVAICQDTSHTSMYTYGLYYNTPCDTGIAQWGIGARWFNITSTGIYFKQAYLGNGTVDNSYQIPVKVWGVNLTLE